MKPWICTVLLVCLESNFSSAEIRNGYTDMQGAQSSLSRINILLREQTNSLYAQQNLLKSKHKILTNYIKWHQITEKLLLQFKTISPETYYQIDLLKDFKGRPVDVYVKFVAEKILAPGVRGIASIQQDNKDPHTCRSEYGSHSVSVAIAAASRPLELLAHELGHVQYQVQNFAEYLKFYNRVYKQGNRVINRTGHSDNDKSGKNAKRFVGRYQKDYQKYVRASVSKLKSHLTLLHEIQSN